jgi:RsmE family RNA methyltransferase
VNIILFEPHEVGRPLPKRDERAIHLIKVLHKKAGDTFEAGILGGSLGSGKIESIRFDGALLYSLDLTIDPPPRLPIRLAVGFPRPIQLRRLLRDLSNMGLEAVDLIGADLGDKNYRNTKMLTNGGARAALIEGAVQARDTTIPALSTYVSLDAWLQEWPWNKALDPWGPRGSLAAGAAPLLIAADNVRPSGAMANLPPHQRPTVLAIGPERGWSDRERDLLEDSGFIRMSLGQRALRTETACVAAAVLAIEKIGELW